MLLLRLSIGVLHELEVRNSALQNLNVRINLLSQRLQHHHVCDQSSELPIQLHVVLTNNVQHTNQQRNPLNIENTLTLQNTE